MNKEIDMPKDVDIEAVMSQMLKEITEFSSNAGAIDATTVLTEEQAKAWTEAGGELTVTLQDTSEIVQVDGMSAFKEWQEVYEEEDWEAVFYDGWSSLVERFEEKGLL
jgi:hypothetical protein